VQGEVLNHSIRCTPATPNAVPAAPAWRDGHAGACHWHYPRGGLSRSRPHGMADPGTRHRQAANMAAPGAGAEELSNAPALWLSHDGRASSRGSKLAVVGMLCCGVSLYRAAAGHEDAQGVANSGASCSRERWFQLMRRDNILTSSASFCTPWMGASSITCYLGERIFTHELYMYLKSWQHF